MKKTIFSTILCLMAMVALWPASARADVPERPEEPRAVVDFAEMFPDSVIDHWHHSLATLYDSTGIQVVVVTVPSLDDMTVEEYAQRLYDKWRFGDKETNKGVLVLVKPKTEGSKGRIRIHTGYGMEGDLPDVFCQSLIDDLAIPSFKEGDYQGGVQKVLNVIAAVANKKYSYGDYQRHKQEAKARAEAKDDYTTGKWTGICCLWPFLLGIWYFFFKRRSSDGISNWDTPISGGGRSRGGSSSSYDSYDSDSSWSSSSSSDSYDYGGGSSGGGGASGSW